MSRQCNGCGDCDYCYNMNCNEGLICDYCEQEIYDDYYELDGNHYHIECFEEKHRHCV